MLSEEKELQTIKVLCGRAYCFKCPPDDKTHKSTELAQVYCLCGSFLCYFCAAGHKCLITQRKEYSEDLLKALS